MRIASSLAMGCVLATAQGARADEVGSKGVHHAGPAPASTTAPTDPPDDAASRAHDLGLDSAVPKRDVATHPLNVKRQLQELGVQFSMTESRLTSHRESRARGIDLLVTFGLAPKLPVLRVAGYKGMVFRAFDSKSFSFTPYFQGLEGGAHLGIFEFGADFGISAISVDVMHAEWSLGLLQPRTSAFAGLKFRELRLRAVALSELYWRWIGEDSAFVRGIGLQLVIGTPNAPF